MSAVKYGLQPLLILACLYFWYTEADQGLVYIAILGLTHILVAALEYSMPARKDWLQPAAEKLTNLLIVIVMTAFTAFIASFYADTLFQPLAELRAGTFLDIWPHDAPLVLQLFMVFFLSEFIWYWLHRAEHRFPIFWRLSGHGAHHSFKRLGAINFGCNHPLEAFLIVLPAALVEITFGVGVAAAGATLLSTVLASLAHANLDLNTKAVGLLFTTNKYHFHHHSVVLEESNTNFGCSAIIWDRIFGTFSDNTTLETGTGPTEPNLWQKIIMPVVEPEDTATAPQ